MPGKNHGIRQRLPSEAKGEQIRMNLPSYAEACLHCKRCKGGRSARGLCTRCYKDLAIRTLYACRPSKKESPVAVPMPDYCRHGTKDGCCPECERTQRAKMVIQWEEVESSVD